MRQTVVRPVDSVFRPVRSYVLDAARNQAAAAQAAAQEENPANQHSQQIGDLQSGSQQQTQPQYSCGQQLTASQQQQQHERAEGPVPHEMEVDPREADKRQRAEGGPSLGLSDSDEDDREILEQQLQVLTALPAAAAEEISTAAYRLQKKYLLRGRQEAEIRENIEADRVPRTLKSNADIIILGKGAEALAPQIKEKEHAHQLELAELLCQAKQLEANSFMTEKDALQREAVDKQVARISRIAQLAPDLYNRLDMTATKRRVERRVRVCIAAAQNDATVHFEDSSTSRKKKQLEHQQKQHLKQAELLRNQTEPTTKSTTELMIEEATKSIRDRLDKVMADNQKLSKQLKNGIGKSIGGNTRRKANNKKGNGKQPETKGKGKDNRSSPTGFKTRVIDLRVNAEPLPAPLLSVLGLGPGFRPTPKPTTDSQVTKSLIQFAGSIRTRAHFAEEPDTDSTYNPKLYLPTGNSIDPEMAELDAVLHQYETEVRTAMNTIPTEYGPPNVTTAERRELTKLSGLLAAGTSDIAICKADKDSAFVVVSREQFVSMWRSHYPLDQYPLIDPITVDWRRIQRNVRLAIDRAQKDKGIDNSTARFLRQYTYGEVRIPKGAVQVKTHKRINVAELPPAKSRMYVDTVQYITTPLTKFLSVHLTPARERIEGRVLSTRQFIVEIGQIVFPQDVSFYLIDIIDFYPNTDPREGRKTIDKYAPDKYRELMLAFSDLVHGSLYQWTPDGLVKVANRYGIGLGHSGEVCDLNWADTEQHILAKLKQIDIHIYFWRRMVDDYFIALIGTEAEKQTIIDAFRTADPNRPVTVERSDNSVNYLDVTIYKGDRFRKTGRVDTKLFTKPTNTELHLPYSSFHPSSTFDSILHGQHQRSLIASSGIEQHTATMLQKYTGYLRRGYPKEKLNRILLQATTRQGKEFKEKRERALTGISKRKQGSKVIALKLPYTNRSIQISHQISVTKLQKQIQTSCPVLNRANMGQMVVTNMSTHNLLERTRPKGLMAGYEKRQQQQQP